MICNSVYTKVSRNHKNYENWQFENEKITNYGIKG